jgi:hypothetical protein
LETKYAQKFGSQIRVFSPAIDAVWRFDTAAASVLHKQQPKKNRKIKAEREKKQNFG